MDIREFVYNRISDLQGNLSDREVSLSIGKNQNYIQSLKLQHSLPSLDALVSICRFFRISLSDFFDTAELDISVDETNFFNNLHAKIHSEDYKILSKLATKADAEDFHMLAIIVEKYMTNK